MSKSESESERVTDWHLWQLGALANKNPHKYKPLETRRNFNTTHSLGSFETTDAVLGHIFFSYLSGNSDNFLQLHGFKPREITSLSQMLAAGRFQSIKITQVIYGDEGEKEEVFHACEQLSDVLPILYYIYSSSKSGSRKPFLQEYPELYTYQPEKSEEEG